MPAPLSGPGLGLQLPQALYPSELQNAPYDSPSNQFGLAPGDVWNVPAGTWLIGLNQYLLLQFLDPVTGTWTFGTAGATWTGPMQYVKSDGFNVRVANLTGCAIAAIVTAYGSAYVQSSTTVTAVGSTSTWQPIVGGQLGTVATFSIAVPNAGAGYGVPPIVLIPPPPPAANNANGVGGIQASAIVTIGSGTISGISIINPGAGYPSAPTAVVVTNPTDPNIATGITQGSVAFSLTGSGSITAVLCTNPGAPLVNGSLNNMTLTVAGAGTGATVVPNVLQTIVTGSVTGAGTGYGSVGALLSTTGGGMSTGTVTNGPEFLGLAFRPRPAQINLAVTALGTLSAQAGTIIDGGLFMTAPNPVIATGNLSGSLGGATLALTMGSRFDIAKVQPAP